MLLTSGKGSSAAPQSHVCHNIDGLELDSPRSSERLPVALDEEAKGALESTCGIRVQSRRTQKPSSPDD